MELNTQSWNAAGGQYNNKAEETGIIGFQLVHEFNKACRCIIQVSDPTGALVDHYNNDTTDNFIAIGQVELEHPTGTQVFEGFIQDITFDRTSGILIISCEDWLNQLKWDRLDLETILVDSVTRTDPDSTYDMHSIYEGITSCQADDGGSITDETVAANDTTEDNMTLFPSTIVQNDAYYFGFASKVTSMKLYISQVGDWEGDVTWEYSRSGNYAALSNAPTGDKKTFEAAGLQEYSWDAESDWIATTVNSVTAYWIRVRCTTAASTTTQPLGRDVTKCEYFLVDDEQTWDVNEWNGYKLIFPNDIAGKQSIKHYPSSYEIWDMLDTTWVTDSDDTNIDHVLTDDANYHAVADDFTAPHGDDSPHVNSSGFYIAYKVRYGFSEATTDESPRYIDGSITGARVKITYSLTSDHDMGGYMYLHNQTTVILAAGGLDGDGNIHKASIEVPVSSLSTLFDADGTTEILVWAGVYDKVSSETTTLKVYYIELELDVETTSYSPAVDITDTTSNRLTVTTDLTNDGAGIWEGCKYNIVKQVFRFFDTGESPIGTLISDHDIREPLTSANNIEHTSGVTNKTFTQRTTFEILEEFAELDGSVFWLPLASEDVHYKKTFNDGSPTALTDATFLYYTTCIRDGKDVINKSIVRGAQFTDSVIEEEDTDATSKTLYGEVDRTNFRVISGITSDLAAETVAGADVDRYKDVRFIVEGVISGISTIRLGSEVTLTSTELGISGANINFVVVKWSYDSFSHKTTVRLHPRTSAGYIQTFIGLESIRNLVDRVNVLEHDKTALEVL